ncbi:DUF488 domain-containing protein [Saccharothrix sp. ST-888]|uniref:DUF488 domain-containing protein n=1 Tax=Saccharothrix sp. ST-888 TaxID=1427391 RepID=UPI0005EC9F09|nr:DUF488 family protein [Saccharothrix sp. ST-888]KJK59260.1 hypothetical protein UK12_05385 [Saccharothrix sp. ST-888]
MARHVEYRRIYADAEPADGVRVLVDRVWPRGLRKDAGAFDVWMKDVAPSTELRRWYGHDPERYREFRRRYLTELRDPDHQDALRSLADLADRGPLTLLTASRDVDHSQAAVLADRLSGNGGKHP